MAAPPDSNGYVSGRSLTLILSAAGLIMLAAGGVMQMQSNAMDGRLRELRDDVHDISKSYLRKDEHEEFKLRLDKDLARIEAEIVPRREVEARAETVDKNYTILSDRLNELRTSTTSTYTVRDEMIRMQAEMAELRKQIADPRTAH